MTGTPVDYTWTVDTSQGTPDFLMLWEGQRGYTYNVWKTSDLVTWTFAESITPYADGIIGADFLMGQSPQEFFTVLAVPVPVKSSKVRPMAPGVPKQPNSGTGLLNGKGHQLP